MSHTGLPVRGSSARLSASGQQSYKGWSCRMCLGFLYKFCLEHFSFWDELSEISNTYIGLHVKYRSFLSDLNETWILKTDFLGKYPNFKFHENPSIGGAVFFYADGKTDWIDTANNRFSSFCEKRLKTLRIWWTKDCGQRRSVVLRTFGDVTVI